MLNIKPSVMKSQQNDLKQWICDDKKKNTMSNKQTNK